MNHSRKQLIFGAALFQGLEKSRPPDLFSSAAESGQFVALLFHLIFGFGFEVQADERLGVRAVDGEPAVVESDREAVGLKVVIFFSQHPFKTPVSGNRLFGLTTMFALFYLGRMAIEHNGIQGSLKNHLDYKPQVLKFGTSGRRGEVVHLTQLEIYINALAELEYLQSLPVAEGGVRCGDEFYFAYDLRPSSTRFVPEQHGRGELAQAIERAIRDAGLRPVNLGPIPTPALACYALDRIRGGMMITGSHIPFDRNGYKTYTSKSELLKQHEVPINARVEQVRQRLYEQPLAE